MEEIYQFYIERYNKACKFNYLRFPTFQSIVNLPKIEKEKIESSITLPSDLHRQLKYELNRKEGTGITKAYNFYKNLDYKRSTDILKELPEWVNIKNNYLG